MQSTLEKIRSGLGHVAHDWKPSEYLDTGIPDLNRVIGHKDKGIPYGKVTEISGWESQGKTALLMALAAFAQHDGALVVWQDVENSFDPGWARQRGIAPCPNCDGSDPDCKQCGGSDSPTAGLDANKLILIQPYVGKFLEIDPRTKKRVAGKNPRLSNAQELCSDAEGCIMAASKTFNKHFLVLDSIPALLTAGEADAGLEGGNLRTNMDLPMFMSRLLRRWMGTIQVTNTHLALVNQLRTDPMQKFGSPHYTPGGNAPLFYSHVRTRVHRVKGGTMKQAGKVIGIQGVMKALKNKSGGEEGAQVGYKIFFKGPVEFVPVKDLVVEKGE